VTLSPAICSYRFALLIFALQKTIPRLSGLFWMVGGLVEDGDIYSNPNLVQEFYFTQRAQGFLMQRSVKRYRNQSICEKSATNTLSIFK